MINNCLQIIDQNVNQCEFRPVTFVQYSVAPSSLFSILIICRKENKRIEAKLLSGSLLSMTGYFSFGITSSFNGRSLTHWGKEKCYVTRRGSFFLECINIFSNPAKCFIYFFYTFGLKQKKKDRHRTRKKYFFWSKSSVDVSL